MAKGWRFQSRRHSLASRGIKTAQKIPKIHQLRSNGNNEEKALIVIIKEKGSVLSEIFPVSASSKAEAITKAMNKANFTGDDIKVYENNETNRKRIYSTDFFGRKPIEYDEGVE